jgi:hypothetical protein
LGVLRLRVVGRSNVAVVGFVGSRSVGPAYAGLVAACVASVTRRGAAVVVGCASGADQLALACALAVGTPAGVTVFAVGGADGSGFARGLVPAGVVAAEAAGCSVRWWAGGAPAVPLRARLALRSRALVAHVAAGGPGSGLVAFLGPGAARGTWAAIRHAAALGVPLVVFPCGAAAPLPPLGFGAWVAAVPAGLWASAFRWVPAM